MSKSKVTKIGHWPSQDVPCCEKHAEKMAAVGQALGMRISFSDTDDDELICPNCTHSEREAVRNHVDMG